MEQVFFGLHENCVRAVTSALSARQRAAGVGVLSAFGVACVFCLVALHHRFCSPTADYSCLPADPRLQSVEVVDLAVGHGEHCVSGVYGGLLEDGAAWLAGALEEREFLEEGREPCRVELVGSFAQEQAFLQLPRALLGAHAIPAATVLVSGEDACLGGGLLRGLMRDVVGYETLLRNWALWYFGGAGYLRLARAATVEPLVTLARPAAPRDGGPGAAGAAGLRITSLLGSALLFCMVSSMVSFTLRQTQQKMLRFTYMLEESVRTGRSYASLVLTHVVDSLVWVPLMVGMLFFLFQFYNDQLVAAAVLTQVWASEVYAMLACRTRASLLFFPRVVVGLFCAFHLYLFCWPAGFTYLALAATNVLLLLTMAALWNHAEVPALHANKISASVPRQLGALVVR